MGKVQGNISTIKKSFLDYLETFIDSIYSPGSYVPMEILNVMAYITGETGKEIGIYLNRKNRVEAIVIGDDRSVLIPEIDNRRGENRLSGVRLLHTHPGGSYMPSDVDLNSLKQLRLDGMIVIGVDERDNNTVVTGVSVTTLTRDNEGKLTGTALHGPYNVLNIARFDELFDVATDTDRYTGEITEETEAGVERAILVGVITENTEEPLAELKELARTAGAVVVGEFTQKRDGFDSKYYMGKGFAEDLALIRQSLNADVVILDDELTFAQIRNLEDVIGIRVIDRTALILDIFAARANSVEGKLQVELAQQKYRLPRLTGMGVEMSRLGGGIGTRGPGETKLQVDRRAINRRINFLEAKIKDIAARREVLRKERKRNELPVISLVGYTNAGKSSLLNVLCGSDVFVEDKLFATLDSTVRKMNTRENKDFLLVDTVGFIKKLPHDLIDAFKSTLEEATQADLLLHVTDASCKDLAERIEVVEQILSDIGAENKPRYLVINKMDKAGEDFDFRPGKSFGKVFYVSALTGEGIEELRDGITDLFMRLLHKYKVVIPYSEGWVMPFLHDKGTVTNVEYMEEGIFAEGTLPAEYIHKIDNFKRG